MAHLPSLRPEEAAKAFEKAGFAFERHGKGSHRIYSRPGHRFKLSIPFHAKSLKTGTLRSLIRDAGLTEEEFLRLLSE